MQYSLAILALAATASANPLAPLVKRQGVTASIAPPEPAPPGCTGAAIGSYAVIVRNITTASPAKRQVTQIADGQPQVTHGTVAQIGGGQIQAGMQTKITMPIANQINDGQIQIQTTIAPVAEYKVGQPQAPTMAMPTATEVSEAADAQAVATTAPAAPAASPASDEMVACDAEGRLAITLENNILKDAQGRTGYIASNFQFQFDGPPQSEAIFTRRLLVLCERIACSWWLQYLLPMLEWRLLQPV
ncbi:hypothetical protein OEA41_001874 [Lepraria neglecta]|uniref:Cell wall mannoprotein PIR1-like C-terminal domain-containing protein n=1 Tax=Lepraria neglecta TaxID=209136 RepID=A0AAD9ZDW5_9LECA|nr:hypothetical protein OEA41_001874 [Lepraria neglecta]